MVALSIPTLEVVRRFTTGEVTALAVARPTNELVVGGPGGVHLLDAATAGIAVYPLEHGRTSWPLG